MLADKGRHLSTRAYSTWRRTIEAKNAHVNALVYTSESSTHLDTADLPLSNVAVAVKDNICTASMPTTCSSAILREFTSPFDATVVDLLRRAGADIVGKTNCDEFGMGSLNIHSVHGPVFNPFESSSRNPHEPRSAGGSSGGSAAAVAAGMCDAALATDTGGSTRLPASYCGVVGLKPSYGLISRWGVVSFADSLDCVGVMSKTVTGAKRVFDILNVYDKKDPTTALPGMRLKARAASQEVLQHWVAGPTPDKVLCGLRIGIPQEYFPSELSPAVLKPLRRVLSALRSRGAELVSVSLPSTAYALSAYYVIASAEASSNMARYDGVQYGMHVDSPPGSDKTKTTSVYARTRSAGFGHEVQKRILLGTYALTADAFDNYFLQAQRVRNRVREDFDNIFLAPNVLNSSSQSLHPLDSRVDVLLHPSAIRTAPILSSLSSSGLDTYVQDVLTVPASLAGLPALNVPMGSADGDGWPVGVSVVGQWGCEEMVLSVGEAVERVAGEL